MGRFDWLTFKRRVYLMIILGIILLVIGLLIFIQFAPPDVFISQSIPDDLTLLGIITILIGLMLLIGTSLLLWIFKDK